MQIPERTKKIFMPINKKKIMMAISTTRGGGAEVHCTRVVEYLSKLPDYEVSMLCFFKSDMWTPPDNVKMYYVGSRKEASLLTRVMRIRDAIRDFKPDLLNAWNPEILSLPAAFWGKMTGSTVITSRMIAHKSIFKGGSLREYLNLLADIVGDGIISNSPVSIRDSWLFKKVFDLRKNIVIPNGIEPYNCENSEQDFASLFKADKNFKIIYAGRFTKVKRINLLLETFFKLKRDGLKISLYMCGGYEKDLGFCSNILDKNKEYMSDIHFFGFQKNWRDFGRHCDLYISASSNEGLSNSLLEAMTIGLPIIVSDIPANTFVCEHEKNALIFKTDDVKSLEESIKRIASDENLRDRLSRNALERAEDFPISKMSESYLKFFKEFL